MSSTVAPNLFTAVVIAVTGFSLIDPPTFEGKKDLTEIGFAALVSAIKVIDVVQKQLVV
tara:strand:- start:4669 stop:4845 length:177 start_codon:yes stop_codon:yes gene_type:complete